MIYNLHKSIILSLQFLFLILLAGCCSHHHTAVQNGIYAAISDAIRDGVDINAKLTDGSSLLSTAIAQEDLASVKLLLEKGADPNTKVSKVGTPIVQALNCHDAAMGTRDYVTGDPVPSHASNYFEIVKLLLEHGADPNGTLVLTWDPEMLKLLLRHGADVSFKYQDGSTAIKHLNNFKAVKVLLENGANLNEIENSGTTALMRAAITGDVSKAKILSDIDKIINQKDSEGWTSLMYSCAYNNIEMAKFLIDRKADVNCSTEPGCTALKLAVLTWNYNLVKLLLESGAKVNVLGNDVSWGDPELSIVLRDPIFNENTRSIMDLLLKYGANIDAGTQYGSIEMTDSINISPKLTEFLCQRGADLNKKPACGYIALIDAAFKGKIEHIKVLLKHKASVNIITTNGIDNFTALDAAMDNLKWIQEDRFIKNSPKYESRSKELRLLDANLIIQLLRTHGAKTAAELKASG